MRRHLTLILLLISALASAEGWISPIDTRYQARDPARFATFTEARELLDAWDGERHKLEQAAALLDAVVGQDRDFAPAYLEYGRLFIMGGFIHNNEFRQQGLARAEAAIQKAITLEPEYADAYVLLGHLYTQMRRFPDAGEALVRADGIGTETPWLTLNWAELYERLGHYDEALERYQRVVDAGTPNRKAFARALAGVTKAHEKLGLYDLADADHRRLIDYDPTSAWLRGNYASFLLYRYDDVERAIENAETALDLRDYGVGRLVLASALFTRWARLRADDAEAAKASFERAWAIYPHPEKIIEETRDFAPTKATAEALEAWLAERDAQQAPPSPTGPTPAI